jgi:hypothetical protein
MAASVEALREKIRSRTARTGVVGLGYVGLPLAVELAKAGFHATGIDLDVRKVDLVNGGRSYIPDVATADVQALRAKGLLDATTDFSVVKDLDTINICVPTPLRKTKDPDMSLHRLRGGGHRKYLHSRHADRPRVDNLSRDDGRSRAADAGGAGAEGGRRLLPRVLAGTGRPGESHVPDAQRAEGRRRLLARLLDARGELYGTAIETIVRSARRASRKWSSCSRTPSAPSTSAW